jgi:hypothetical protein
MHWAWIKYPRRGDDGVGIAASNVNPESDGALALKSLPLLPGAAIGSAAWRARYAGTSMFSARAGAFATLAAAANASKEKAAWKRHADRIMRCFRQIVGSDAKWRARPVILSFWATALATSRMTMGQ